MSAFEQTDDGRLFKLAEFSYRLIPLQVSDGPAFDYTVETMEIWSASGDGVSFVISYQSPAGPGFRGRLGYVASWSLRHQSRGAIKIGGSPFTTFAEAEDACDDMLKNLTRKD